MTSAGSAYVEILPSMKGFSSNLSGETHKAAEEAGHHGGEGYKEKFLESAKGIGEGLAVAFAAIQVKDFLGEAITGATNLQKQVERVDTVFGSSSEIIKKSSEEAARSMGISSASYLTSAGSLGNLLTAMKIAPNQAAEMSTKILQLSADMGSFANTSPEAAMKAIQAGLAGATRGLKQYGVVISPLMLQQEAFKEGLIKTVKTALTPQQKALASYALILQQTGKAQGAFGRNSGDLANQQKILGAEMSNLQDKVGLLLLPVLSALSGFLINDVVPAFGQFGHAIETTATFIQNHSTAFGIIAGIITTLLIPSLTAMAVSSTVTAATTVLAWGQVAFWATVGAAADVASAALVVGGWVLMGVQSLLAAAKMAAAWIIALGPIALVTAAVIAIVALIIANWGTIKRVTIEVWQAVVDFVTGVVGAVVGFVKDHWELLVGILTGPIGIAVALIAGHWDTIKSDASAAFNWVKNTIETIWGQLVSFFTGLPGSIAGVFSGLFDGIKTAFKSAINFVIDAWNSLHFSIPSFDTHIPGVGKVGGGTISVPQIPRLASGGIVTKPTLAVIGEAGPEAVVPLNQRRAVPPLTINHFGKDLTPAAVVSGLNQWHVLNGGAVLAGLGV